VYPFRPDAEESVDNAGAEKDGAKDSPAGCDLRLERKIAFGECGFTFSAMVRKIFVKATYRWMKPRRHRLMGPEARRRLRNDGDLAVY
jgi:hypothetical protein